MYNNKTNNNNNYYNTYTNLMFWYMYYNIAFIVKGQIMQYKINSVAILFIAKYNGFFFCNCNYCKLNISIFCNCN